MYLRKWTFVLFNFRLTRSKVPAKDHPGSSKNYRMELRWKFPKKPVSLLPWLLIEWRPCQWRCVTCSRRSCDAGARRRRRRTETMTSRTVTPRSSTRWKRRWREGTKTGSTTSKMASAGFFPHLTFIASSFFPPGNSIAFIIPPPKPSGLLELERVKARAWKPGPGQDQTCSKYGRSANWSLISEESVSFFKAWRCRLRKEPNEVQFKAKA